MYCLVAEPDAVNGCVLKSNDAEVDQDQLLGYLAGSPGTISRGRRQRGHECGTERSPWTVVARLGQRIRFTLMDFSSTTDQLDVNAVEGDAVQPETMSRQHNDGQFVVHLTYKNIRMNVGRYLRIQYMYIVCSY